MIWVDVFIVVILGISSMLGAWRGMVRELLSLSFLVLAVVIAQSYGTVVSEMLVSVVANGTVRYFVAVCCLFFAVLIFVFKLSYCHFLITYSPSFSIVFIVLTFVFILDLSVSVFNYSVCFPN